MPDAKLSALSAAATPFAGAGYLYGIAGGVSKKFAVSGLSQRVGHYNAVADGGCVADGVTDDTVVLQAALTAAAALAHKRLYLPAGTYLVTKATGAILASATNGMEIFGDGEGKTVLYYGPNQTLTGDVQVIQLTGSDQDVHDLSVVAGTGLKAGLNAFAGIIAGGSGYTNGDSLTLIGGTNTQAAVVTVTVSGGAVNGVSAITTAGLYTVQGVIGSTGAAYTTTGGTGTGASIQVNGPKLTAINPYQGCLRPTVRDVEISGIWGLNNAGGEGIATYQPPQTNEAATTFADNILAGARTVTPLSMAGIYPGRTLRITGTNPETIQVTSTTATTFTATFANTHNTATVNVWSLGHQYGRYENVYIHDCFQASATVFNSGENVVHWLRVMNCGMNAQQHGIYDQQGGHNVFEDCYVEGIAGFSYHVHIAASAIADASGNRFVHCYSVNPGAQHMIIDSATGDGTDPTVPTGNELNRYVAAIGCVFKCTLGANNPSTGLGVGVQTANALFAECVWEDASRNGASLTLSSGSAAKQVVSNCAFRLLAGTYSNPIGVVAGNNAVVQGCQFTGWTAAGCKPLRADGSCAVLGNYFDHAAAGATTVTVNGDDVIVANNRGAVGGSSGSAFVSYSGAYKADIYGNRIVLASGAHFWYDGGFAPLGQVHDNTWSGSTGGVRWTTGANSALIDWYNNTGIFNHADGTTNNMAVNSRAGRLLSYAKSTNTATGKKGVKLDGSAITATSDTQWLGFAVSDLTATAGNGLVAGWCPGQIVIVACSTAWVAGNIAICSTGTAGSVMTTGTTTPPASPASYGVFLDAGGAAGDATIMVMKAGR